MRVVINGGKEINRGFNVPEYLRNGSTFENVIKKDQSLSQFFSHIDIRKGAMEVKNAGYEDNDVLFHLMQVGVSQYSGDKLLRRDNVLNGTSSVERSAYEPRCDPL